MAAATPAQQVPWPAAAESSDGLASLSPKSQPVVSLRSACPRSAPVSMIAMITEGEPKKVGASQARSASASKPGVPTVPGSVWS